VRAIGPTIWALGAKAPMARPTKRTAPTPRKAPEIDLADQIAEADGEKRRKDRLRSNDVAGEIQHFQLSPAGYGRCFGNQRTRHPAARNCSNPGSPGQASAHAYRHACIPRFIAFHLNAPSWWNGWDLDPLNVLHRRDEFSDPLDVRRIVRQARHEREADPHSFADRREALCEAQIGADPGLWPCDRSRGPSS